MADRQHPDAAEELMIFFEIIFVVLIAVWYVTGGSDT